jgi:excisionase family DNA binding protein
MTTQITEYRALEISTTTSSIATPFIRRDAARILRCSERKVDRLLRDGRLKFTKVGRSVLICPHSLAALVTPAA